MSSGGQRWWSSLSTAGGVVVLGSRCEQLAQSRYAAAQTSFDATGESMSVNADCRYRMADGCKQPVLMFSCLDLSKLVSKYVGMRVSDFLWHRVSEVTERRVFRFIETTSGRSRSCSCHNGLGHHCSFSTPSFIDSRSCSNQSYVLLY